MDEKNVSKEIQFAQTIQKVKELAKLSGNQISKAEIDEQFSSLQLDEEQMKLVYEYLEKANIGIDKEIDADAFLTGEDTHYLQLYLEELKEVPEFSEGEKEALTLSSMAGDVNAQSELIQAFLPQIIDLAKLYAGQGVYLEDLIGEGNLSLIQGVTMLGCFEHAKEAQGALVKMIMDAMEELIALNVAEEEFDLKVVERVNEVTDKAKELSEALGRKVTKEELIEETGMELETVLEAIRFSAGQIEYLETDD